MTKKEPKKTTWATCRASRVRPARHVRPAGRVRATRVEQRRLCSGGASEALARGAAVACAAAHKDEEDGRGDGVRGGLSGCEWQTAVGKLLFETDAAVAKQTDGAGRLPLHCASRHHQQNPVALSAGERQKRPLSKYGWTLTRRGYATTFFTSPSTILSAPSHRPSRRG